MKVVQNPTRERIIATLREYSQRQFGEGDQLFIFFAGHGHFDEVFQQGYIVAKDSRKDDETRGSYASYDDLQRIIDSMRARHVLLVMDACYSGTFDRRMEDTRGSESYASFSLPELFENKAKFKTRRYLTSGGKEYVPDGDPNRHSPFAAHLLEVLRTYGGKQGYLTLASVFAGVEQTKPAPYWGYWGHNDPGSEFLFISKRLAGELLANGQPVSGNSPGKELERGDVSAPEPPAGKARPSIAVLGFRNLSRKPENDLLSAELTEWLTTELAAGDKLRAVASENVARTKLNLALQDSSGYSHDTLGRIYKALGSEYVVSGSYATPEGKIRVDLRLQNALSGEMIAEISDTTKSGEYSALSDLVSRAAKRLREKLGIPLPSAPEATAAKAAQPSNAEASRLYNQGVANLRIYNLLDARDQLERAVRSDPKFTMAHHALGKAWAELGYDGKAREETASAMDLAKNLSRQHRLMIQGSYLQLTAQWEEAIKNL